MDFLINIDSVIKILIIIIIIYILYALYKNEKFAILNSEPGDFTIDGIKYFFTLDKNPDFDLVYGLQTVSSPDWLEITNLVSNNKEVKIDRNKFSIVGLTIQPTRNNQPRARLTYESNAALPIADGFRIRSGSNLTNRRFIIKKF